MVRPEPDADGVVASSVELVEIATVSGVLTQEPGPFSAGELAYARARSDPERRLAARLAAKRALLRLLGDGLSERDVEVVRGEYGPPVLRLSPAARGRQAALGATRVLVSLTHERAHAAALVLLLRDA
jgi:holo-[acyl-carrier protein] synthase